MYGPLDKILDPGLRATFTFLHIGLNIADSPTLHRQHVIEITHPCIPAAKTRKEDGEDGEEKQRVV